MNSVMDDSRLLTLPSNERIRLLPHMKVGRLVGPGGLHSLVRGFSCVCFQSVLLFLPGVELSVEPLIFHKSPPRTSKPLTTYHRSHPHPPTTTQMIFEIRDLKFATPATATRAGILYISESRQWANMVASWLDRVAKPYAEKAKWKVLALSCAGSVLGLGGSLLPCRWTSKDAQGY